MLKITLILGLIAFSFPNNSNAHETKEVFSQEEQNVDLDSLKRLLKSISIIRIEEKLPPSAKDLLKREIKDPESLFNLLYRHTDASSLNQLRILESLFYGLEQKEAFDTFNMWLYEQQDSTKSQIATVLHSSKTLIIPENKDEGIFKRLWNIFKVVAIDSAINMGSGIFDLVEILQGEKK